MNWVASRKETRDRTVSQQRAVQSPLREVLLRRHSRRQSACGRSGMALCDLGARARLMRYGRGWPRGIATARCVGFTIGGLAVGWRWPRWRCNSLSHSGMSISTASIAATPLSALSGSGAQASQLPAPHPGNDADDDYCAICATIFLAATTFLPPAPQLPVPSASQTIERFDRVPVVFIASRRAPFQSRAPPLA